jgi:hypothetical protein
MQIQSAVFADTQSGYLNDVYASSRRRRKIVKCRTRTVWEAHINFRYNTKLLLESNPHCTSLNCCGISEFQFTVINPEHASELEDHDFEEFIAKFLDTVTTHHRKSQFYICGLPLAKNNPGSTMYNFAFYNRLYKVLLKFGFKELTDQGVNLNSNNKLAILGVRKSCTVNNVT